LALVGRKVSGRLAVNFFFCCWSTRPLKKQIKHWSNKKSKQVTRVNKSYTFNFQGISSLQKNVQSILRNIHLTSIHILEKCGKLISFHVEKIV
jgi:hypothetical protein